MRGSDTGDKRAAIISVSVVPYVFFWYSPSMLKRTISSLPDHHIAVAKLVLDRWRGLGRPIMGAFIQGSVARNGYIARGSDLDVRIVVPGKVNPEWFEERTYGPYVVETFPLALADIQDDDRVLAAPALPLAICECVVLYDPEEILAQLRARLVPRLCNSAYIRRRAAACFTDAQASYSRANIALEQADLIEARRAFSSGVWHTTGMVSVIACQSPTSRRAFMLLREAAVRWGCADLLTIGLGILGSDRLTEAEARRLAEICGAIGPRYHEGPLAMIDAGEFKEAAWPLFFSALWGGGGRNLQPGLQDEIFAVFGFDTLAAIRYRLSLGQALADSLLRIAGEREMGSKPCDY